jgi:predicted nucleic acid-binding protein
MVLVDTSVWIRFLKDESPYAAEMARLLDAEEVSAHELIYGELLIGDRGDRTTLLTEYARMKATATIAHSEVVAFVRARRLNSRGVGWIDVHLLASAIVGQLKLWTVDQSLSTLAHELGIAYTPPGTFQKNVF